MRILLAITSCIKFALNGSNQAARETFLADLSKFPGLDYKFFMGDGTPTGNDEGPLQNSLKDCPHAHLDSPRISLDDPNPYRPKDDEVVLHVPDDYIYHTWKTKAYLSWSLTQDYDFIFNAAGDTYVDLERLRDSGFEAHDYLGRHYGTFAVGGSGYWLIREAAQCLVNEPATDWATDRWIGITLAKHGFILHGDQRYSASPEQNYGTASEHRSPLFPEPGNDQITAHLAEAPGIYHPSLMYKAHSIRFGTTELVTSVPAHISRSPRP